MVDIWWNLIKIVTISIHTQHTLKTWHSQMRHENEMKKKAENVNKLIKHCRAEAGSERNDKWINK